MKSAFFTLLSLFIVCNLSAQVAPNFTLVDLDGNSHELYEYLDNNKVVILDFYAEWCGPCQQNAAGVEAVWEAYGPDGTNEVMILGLEADDDSTDEQVEQYAIDWNCNNPQINDTGDVADWYNIEYYPTYLVVCPDRSYQEWGGGPSEIEDVLIESLVYCEEWFGLEADARIFSYNNSTVLCSETTTPTITIMNMGTVPLTTVTIELFLNGELQESINWSGSLDTFETDIVSFGTLDLSGTTDPIILIQTLNPNGMPDENELNDSIEEELSYGGVNYETPNIRFELAFDNFPQETDWEFLNSQGEVVASGGDYDGWPYFSPPIDEILDLPVNDCYTFNIYDSAGDGICCAYADPGEGFWRISTSDDVLIAEGGTFTNQESALFGMTGDVSIIEHKTESLTVFPNPAFSEITLNIESTSFDWTIYGLDGQLYDRGRQNQGNSTLDIHKLNAGTYFIQIDTGSKLQVQKFVKL